MQSISQLRLTILIERSFNYFINTQHYFMLHASTLDRLVKDIQAATLIVTKDGIWMCVCHFICITISHIKHDHAVF